MTILSDFSSDFRVCGDCAHSGRFRDPMWLHPRLGEFVCHPGMGASGYCAGWFPCGRLLDQYVKETRETLKGISSKMREVKETGALFAGTDVEEYFSAETKKVLDGIVLEAKSAIARLTEADWLRSVGDVGGKEGDQ